MVDKAAEKTQYMQSLYSGNHWIQHNDVVNDRHDDTGNAILTNTSFVQWLDAITHSFHCYGPRKSPPPYPTFSYISNSSIVTAGIGKTILAFVPSSLQYAK